MARVYPDFNKEIQKHEFLIEMNQRNLTEQTELDRIVPGIIANPNKIGIPQNARDYVKAINRACKAAPLHIKHSQFMIKIIQGILERNMDKLKISFNCMKQNACDIEQMMAEQVKDGAYTEQEYIEHMGRFRDEIKRWELWTEHCD